MVGHEILPLPCETVLNKPTVEVVDKPVVGKSVMVVTVQVSSEKYFKGI